ncbi:metallophosphoesterase [Mediterraneibacter faecis]|uniref:metallophosphoesterase n=1 Tax=Mediterraneibacter faecis TaxID=592978 RepID=UPI0022AA4B3A|nr:metallophosphoesterase [Mediterraneibacter faecis]
MVVLAGDIFDNEYEALDDPKYLSETLHQIQSKYGTYAVYGNHDVKETLVAGFSIGASKKALRDPRMDEFMEKAGITVLEDESELIDQKFYLVGRLDGEKNGRGTSKRKSIEELTADLDQTKPLFVMNHELDELKEYDKAGVDVLFSGHTHAGQFFPLTIVQPFAWKNYWGVKKIGDMYSIVTSGVGVYGPNIRVGTDSEIMVVTVHFE